MRVDPQAPDAPLLQLVRKLHADTTLADRVIRVRWRRTRPVAQEVDVAGLDEALEQMQKNTPNER